MSIVGRRQVKGIVVRNINGEQQPLLLSNTKCNKEMTHTHTHTHRQTHACMHTHTRARARCRPTEQEMQNINQISLSQSDDCKTRNGILHNKTKTKRITHCINNNRTRVLERILTLYCQFNDLINHCNYWPRNRITPFSRQFDFMTLSNTYSL